MKKIGSEIMTKLEDINRETLMNLLEKGIKDPKEEILNDYIKAKKKGETE